MKQLYLKSLNKLAFFFFLLLFILTFTKELRAGGGGSCTFADNCTSATTFTFCSPVSADNSACQSCGRCDYGDNTITGAPGNDYFGVVDHCDYLYNNIYGSAGCADYTYTDACGECICKFTNYGTGCMGVTTVSSSTSFCGTPENTSYSRMCVPATFVENSASCNFLFAVSGISCSGGAATFQWGIYPSTAACATLATNFPSGSGMLYCENSTTAAQNITANLTPGTCYLLFFDGNAEASCTWTFNITPPTPVATYTGPTTGCVGTAYTFTSTATCYNNLGWTNTGNGTTGTAGTYSVTWASAGTYSVCLTARSNSAEFAACAGASYTDLECKNITISVCCVQPTISLVSQTNILCFGASTGAINISVAGGTAPYIYIWSSGASTEDITARPAGTYTVTVTESAGCTRTASYTLTQNPQITITPTVTNVLCPCDLTGSITTVVGGGVPGYTYIWSSGTSASSITGVAAGTYTVTVTDSKACTRSSSSVITQPAPIVITQNALTNADCFGVCNGTVQVTASGGTGPYDYSSNGGGSYLFNNQAGSVTFTTLCAGNYDIVVRDANNCITP